MEQNYSRIEIKSTDGIYAKLYIDGHVVHGVRSLKFEKKALDMPVLTLDLLALDISIDSPSIIKQEGLDEEIEIVFKDKNQSI